MHIAPLKIDGLRPHTYTYGVINNITANTTGQFYSPSARRACACQLFFLKHGHLDCIFFVFDVCSNTAYYLQWMQCGWFRACIRTRSQKWKTQQKIMKLSIIEKCHGILNNNTKNWRFEFVRVLWDVTVDILAYPFVCVLVGKKCPRTTFENLIV